MPMSKLPFSVDFNCSESVLAEKLGLEDDGLETELELDNDRLDWLLRFLLAGAIVEKLRTI